MKLSTKKCFKRQHLEFCLEFDPVVPRQDVDQLLSYLEQSVENGTRYEKGQSFQLGSVILQITDIGKALCLYEPDFTNIPIVNVPGVTNSLKLERLHRDVADSVGLVNELDFPSIYFSLVAGADLAEQSDSFVLERLNSGNPDSGWFIGNLHTNIDYNDPNNLHCISVYQAIINWPSISGYLALPVGCYVETSRDNLEVLRNGRRLIIRKESLLHDAKLKRSLKSS